MTEDKDIVEHRALLWDAINQYVEACGGHPNRHVYGNTKRQRCVVEIEKIVYQFSNDCDAICDAPRDCLDAIDEEHEKNGDGIFYGPRDDRYWRKFKDQNRRGRFEHEQTALIVIGDHPVLMRPDKVFKGENAKVSAELYASMLRGQGYENVTVKPCRSVSRS